MARLNLIQLIACRAKIAAKNFDLRSTIDGAISSLTQSATSFVSSVVSNVQGQVSGFVSSIANQVQSAQQALAGLQDSITSQFNATVTSITDRLNQVTGLINSTCPDADTAIPQIPKVNVISEVASLPKNNDPASIQSSPDAQNQKHLADAKSQTVLQTATVIGNINGQLSTKGPSEIREQVRQLKDQHPLLNPYVGTLTYFQPISESVGASFLVPGYTPDKSVLQLRYWNQPNASTGHKAYAIRKNIARKVPNEIVNEIEANYDALNTKLFQNISNEFKDEAQTAPLVNFAHAWHIRGDSQWNEEHIINNNVPGKVLAAMNTADPNFKNNVSMVNYLVPIQEQFTITNDTYDVVVEGQTITVDKRNNRVVNPTNVVNNNALKPVKALEA